MGGSALRGNGGGGRQGAPLDPSLIARWEVLHAVHGWAQVATLHAGGFEGTSSADPGKVPVGLIDFLRRRIDHALTDEG